MEINVFDAYESFFDDLRGFYLSYYPENSKIFHEKYLKWLLLDNPFGCAKCVTVIFEGNVIGNMFLIPVGVTKNGDKKMGYFATDVLTHPEHRDKNLFVKMIRESILELKKTNKFILGHPNSNAVPGWKRTKMSFCSPIRSYISKPNIFKRRLTHTVISSREQLSNLQEEIKLINEGSENLVVDSDYDYLIWRFLEHPTQQYKLSAIYDKDKFCGLLISYKYKGLIDRVLHYMIKENKQEEVFNSSLIPKIFHFPTNDDMNNYRKFFYVKHIGSEINFFFTNYADIEKENVSFITFAACDL